MPSTYTSLHYHLVFSTKNRVPLIDANWRGRLHEYLGGTIRGLGGVPETIGGVADHVHILAGLKPTHCLSDFMQKLKKNATDWVHDEIKMKSFYWQEGYAAFSVGATSRKGVRGYINDQENHHKMKTFRDELIELLEMSGVEYDPKYLD